MFACVQLHIHMCFKSTCQFTQHCAKPCAEGKKTLSGHLPLDFPPQSQHCKSGTQLPTKPLTCPQTHTPGSPSVNGIPIYAVTQPRNLTATFSCSLHDPYPTNSNPACLCSLPFSPPLITTTTFAQIFISDHPLGLPSSKFSNSQSNISTTHMSSFHFLFLFKVLCWAPFVLRIIDQNPWFTRLFMNIFCIFCHTLSTHPPFSPATLGIFQILKNTQNSLTLQGRSIYCFLFLETSCLYLDNSSEENLSLTLETELDFLDICSHSITLAHKYILNYLFSPTDCKLSTLLIPLSVMH